MAVRGMHRHIAVAAVLVALLAGCNEGAEGPTPTDPPPTDSTTVNSDDSAGDARGGDGADGADGSDGQSEPPEVEVPARPAEMDEETVAGAIAAAKYFMELMPYVIGTSDLAQWDEMSLDGCEFCASIRSSADAVDDGEGFATGGEVEIYSEQGGGPYADSAFEGEDVYIVSLGLTVGAMELHYGDGTVDSYPEDDRPDFRVSLVRRDGTWRVTGVRHGESQ